jgi:hyperosmotically inducible periplasmic protein
MTKFIWKSLAVAVALSTGAALAADDPNRTSIKTKTKKAGADINDGTITAQVKAKLTGVKGVKASQVRVDTNDRVVSLSGMVASEDVKRQAEKAARDVDRVRDVKNMLTVGTASAAATTGVNRDDKSVNGYGDRTDRKGADFEDGRIAAAVKLRLLTTSDVPATDINVDVADRVVYLFGMVPTEATKKAAEAEAMKTENVARIDNQLQVVPSNRVETASAKDNDIQRDINLRFKERDELDDLETVVEGGMVRVKGEVDNQYDLINALRLIRSIPGVKGVQNLVKVDEKDDHRGMHPDRRY